MKIIYICRKKQGGYILRRLITKYVIFSYLMFFGFIALIGFVMLVLKMDTLAKILQTVSAWSSTFVFALMFRSIYPNDKFFSFVKRQFAEKIKVSVVLTTFGILFFVLIGSLLFSSIYYHKSLSELIILSPVTLVILFFQNLISGPLGEELGWRAFFLTEIEKNNTLIKSAIITGVLWGFWHTPLWLISGFVGVDLIIYIFCFLVSIISFSVILTILYKSNKNLFIPILAHQLFNYFMGIQTLDMIYRILATGIFTFIAAFLYVVIYNKKRIG